MPDDRKINYTAPVVPLPDYPADGEVIRACPFCLPWHAEVVINPLTDRPMIREWHAVGCDLIAVSAEEDPPPVED